MQNPASIEEKRKPENKTPRNDRRARRRKLSRSWSGNTKTKTKKWLQREESLGFVVCVRSSPEQLVQVTGPTRSRIWRGVCKPNVTHVTLSARYVREWGTWPARDARTVNPSFVRFKTWGGGGTLQTGDWAWLDRRATALALLCALPSPPPSHHCHPHCLSPSLSHHHNSSAPAHENLTCLISIKNRLVYIAGGVVCGGLATELRPPQLGLLVK